MEGAFGFDFVHCYFHNSSLFNRRNGLAFITFTQRDSVEKTLAVQHHIIDSSKVNCQRVRPFYKLRTRLPENDNCENWSKEKEDQDQPRCDFFGCQPENISQSTEELVVKREKLILVD
jgi:hypothetical protein